MSLNWLQWSDADSPLLHKSKDNYPRSNFLDGFSFSEWVFSVCIAGWKFLSCWNSAFGIVSLNFVPTEGSRKISNDCSEFWVGIWSNILWYFFITNGKYMIWFSSLCEGWWMGKREQTVLSFLIYLGSFRFRVSWSPWDVYSSWTHLQSVFYDFFSHTVTPCSLWLFSKWRAGAGTWIV